MSGKKLSSKQILKIIVGSVLIVVGLCLKAPEIISRYSRESFTAGNTKFVCTVSELPDSCSALYIRPFSAKELSKNHAEYWEENSFCLLTDHSLTLEELEHISDINVEKLVFQWVSPESLDPLSRMNGLKLLWLNTNSEVKAEFGGSFPSLEKLYIHDDMDSTGNISRITTLKELELQCGEGLTELTGFEKLTSLERLDIRGTKVGDISCLSGCTKMRELYIGGTDVYDIAPLKNMNELEVFYASQNYDHQKDKLISDISALADKPKLREVDLYGTDVTDISPLSGNTALEKAELSYTPIKSAAPLMNLPKLCDVGMYHCDNISDSDRDEFFAWYRSLDHDVYYCKSKLSQSE